MKYREHWTLTNSKFSGGKMIEDHTEEERWLEEFDKNPPECYLEWWSKHMPEWWLQKDRSKWEKLMEKEYGL